MHSLLSWSLHFLNRLYPGIEGTDQSLLVLLHVSIFDVVIPLRMFVERLHWVHPIVVKHPSLGRHQVFTGVRHQQVGEVQIDADSVVGSIHRLAAYLLGRSYLIGSPEGALCDQVRVFLRCVPSEVRVLEHVDADVVFSDELHQLWPRVCDSRNENLVQVRDGHVAMLVSHAIQTVIERGSLAVDTRHVMRREWPANYINLLCLVQHVTDESLACLIGGSLHVYGDLFRTEQFVKLEYFNHHFPLWERVVQRGNTQCMGVCLHDSTLPVQHHERVPGGSAPVCSHGGRVWDASDASGELTDYEMGTPHFGEQRAGVYDVVDSRADRDSIVIVFVPQMAV